MRYRSTSLCTRILISVFVLTSVYEVHAALDTNSPALEKVYNLSESKSIICELSGDSFTWELVVSSNENQLVSETEELNKTTLLSNGEGIYICKATDSAGIVSTEKYSISFSYSSQDPIFDIRASYQYSISNLQYQNSIKLEWRTFHDARPISTYTLSQCPRYLPGQTCNAESYELENVRKELDTEILQFNHSYTIRDVLPYHW